MFKNICDENLINIISYLNNKDSLTIVKLCKYNKNLFYKKGFLKNLSFTNPHGDPFNFAMHFSIHEQSLQHVHVSHMRNPQYYMVNNWPKNVLINFCRIDSQINPKMTQTEKLKINQLYHSYKQIINWSKFTLIYLISVFLGVAVIASLRSFSFILVSLLVKLIDKN